MYTMWLINKNKVYQICKCHVFVHASTALYQLYSLCMSHHETIHSRHLLQLTLLASICVNIAVRTTSNNQTRGVLKAWLAGKKNFKLTQNCGSFLNDVDSVELMLYIVALFQPHSLWCFLSCGVVTNKICAQNPIPAWKNMPMMAIIASLPLAISALSFLVFSAGSEEVNTLNPKSPAYAALPGVCSWETSQKAM